MRALRTSAWVLALFSAFLPTASAKVIYAYVINNESGTVSVIDTSNNELVKTIPVGIRLSCLAINPAGSFVYVADSVSYRISVISTASNSIVDSFSAVETWDIVFARNGRTAYMSTGGNSVFVLNTKTKTFKKAIMAESGTSALAITPNGKFLYVVNDASGTVSVISMATKQIVTNIALGDLQGGNPGGIGISPDGSMAYVTYTNIVQPQNQSGVLVISTASNTVVNTIDVPGSPSSATVTPDGQWLYVSQPSLGVTIIDTSTQTVTTTIPGDALGVAFTADGAFAYVSSSQGSDVGVIDTVTQAWSDEIYLGENFYPIGVAVMQGRAKQ
jgi:YVTN family beta-propeller protein